jgi:hypothetical protein
MIENESSKRRMKLHNMDFRRRRFSKESPERAARLQRVCHEHSEVVYRAACSVTQNRHDANVAGRLAQRRVGLQ